MSRFNGYALRETLRETSMSKLFYLTSEKGSTLIKKKTKKKKRVQFGS